MAAKKHLKNAPIKEAIIDFRVSFDESILIDSLQDKLSDIADDYPTVEPLKRGKIELHTSGEELSSKTINEGVYSLKFIHKEGKYIAQFQKDGFALSRLDPYEDWETFRSEAFRLWDIYKQETLPNKLLRIATRYINSMYISHDMDIEELINAPPKLPAETDGEVKSFFTRIVFKDDISSANVILTRAINQPTDEQTEIILDIDAFFIKEYEISDPKYLSDVDILRELKNRVFFQSITNYAMDKYS